MYVIRRSLLAGSRRLPGQKVLSYRSSSSASPLKKVEKLTLIRNQDRDQDNSRLKLTEEEKRELLTKSIEQTLLKDLKNYNDLKAHLDQPKVRKETLLREYTHEIPIKYQPEYLEPKWQNYWRDCSLNYPHCQKEKMPFTLSTKIGNVDSKYNLNDAYAAVMNDVLARRNRMMGRDTLWVQTLLDGGLKTQFAMDLGGRGFIQLLDRQLHMNVIRF